VSNATHDARGAISGIEGQVLTIRPRHCAGIGAGIWDHTLHDQTRRSNVLAKFDRDHRQGFPGIRGIVAERGAPHAAWFVLTADTGDEWVLARLLGRVENLDRAGSRDNHTVVREANPLVVVLEKQFIAMNPVFGLVLAPVRVNPLGNL
jgi:hypothetical protein